MVGRARRLLGTGSVTQGTHRHCVPHSRGPGVHGDYPSAIFAGRVEAPAHLSGDGSSAGDRAALARSGDDSQSALLCIFHACRAGRVSRFFLVLFLQRTPAALPESALPARLQHRTATSFLGAEPGVAVSLVGLSSGCSHFVVPAHNSGWTDPPDGRLLDRAW